MAVNEKAMSPSDFVAEGRVPAPFFENYNQALSLVAYHFRELEKAGCIECAEVVQVRGVIQHIYTNRTETVDSEEQREGLPMGERSESSRRSMQGLIARADSALRNHTFDRRVDRHLDVGVLSLDDAGWSRLNAILANTKREVDALREEAARSGTTDGSESSTDQVTVAFLAFPSPPAIAAPGRSGVGAGATPSSNEPS